MLATRVIHVIAGITAKGDHMNSKTTEETDTAHMAGTHNAKAGKKARVAPKRASPATQKTKGAPRAESVGKASKTAKKATITRDGSKASSVLDLLKRANGVTLAELMKSTGWQAHSVRGFLSGTIGKKKGLTVTSAKGKSGERSYFVKA
jgi:Protein of unknown function (DUF3489)